MLQLAFPNYLNNIVVPLPFRQLLDEYLKKKKFFIPEKKKKSPEIPATIEV
jgi:hypothetical protein